MTRQQLDRIFAKENESKLRTELDVLDNRELELFSIMAQGYSSAQIQSEFGFHPKEFLALRQRLQKKLRMKSEAQLRRLAQQHGSSL